MARKAGWILVLLIALIAISSSVAFAAGMTRWTKAGVELNRAYSAAAKSMLTNVSESSGKSYDMSRLKSYGRGDCPYKDSTASSQAAY